MEKDNLDVLQKNRSTRACIRDGFRFYISNFRQILRNTWPVAIGFALLSMVASALPVLFSPTLLIWGLLIGGMSVILLLIGARLMLHKRQMLYSAGKTPIMAWLTHFGAVLLITIVCLFAISILTMLTSLPGIILMAANWQSQMGVINGDPIGMPDYVYWLSLAVFLLAGFIQAYVWLIMLFPFHLLKASLACKEEDMKKFNNINNV